MNTVNRFFTPDTIRQLLTFCSKNSYQHINALLIHAEKSGAEFEPSAETALRNINADMQKIYADALRSSSPANLIRPFIAADNMLINLSERIKFEGCNGYPELTQYILHILYEQRFFKFLFLDTGQVGNALFTTRLNAEPKPSSHYLIYNGLYFFSAIGAMHAGTLMHDAEFSRIAPDAANHAADITKKFNGINKNLAANANGVFKNFKDLNSEMTEFLRLINSRSTQIFTGTSHILLPQSFFDGTEHMLTEHEMMTRAANIDFPALKIPK